MKSVCPNCSHVVRQAMNSSDGNVGWCPKCGQVFERFIPEIPPWIHGVLAVLIAHLYIHISSI